MVMPSVSEPPERQPIPFTARLLGFLGLLPFILLALLLHFSPEPELKIFIGRSLISYAAVIISFLGGVRWGLALHAETVASQTMHFTLAVFPSIIAWLLLTARLDTAIAAFAILYALVGLLDAISLGGLDSPPWYRRLRSMLSILVVIALVGAMFAL